MRIFSAESGGPFVGAVPGGDRRAVARAVAAAAGRPWDRCAAYRRFAASVDAAVVLPQCGDSPGGRWSAQCLEAPYTRLPRGDEVATPSCLDVLVAPRRACASARVSWALAVDDHAALVVSAVSPLRRAPRRWRPVSPTSLKDSVARVAEALPPRAAPAQFRSVVRSQMRVHADRRSAAMRRAARVLFVARQALSRAARSVTEAERVAHRQVARSALVAESARRRRAAVREVARRGGNVAPRRPMHDVPGITRDDGSVESDTAVIGSLLLAHFVGKWGGGRRCGLA